MNHSPVGLFIFSLFFFSHYNGVFNEIENIPIGFVERIILLKNTDQCVLRFLDGKDAEKSLALLPFLIDRCALSKYFQLEEYGNQHNDSSVFTFFPLFQHSHLRRCNTFLFFGASSLEMSAELEILASNDFQMFDCNYFMVEKRKNIHGLTNFLKVSELTASHMNDILMQFKDDKQYIIEHLFVSEMREMSKFAEKVLEIRRDYYILACQITIRFPRKSKREVLWKFAEKVLENDEYVLLNFRRTSKFIEFYLLSTEYQCVVRYL